MENQNLGKELFNLEKKYWQAMKDKDFQTMLSLSDDPCLIAGAQGIASLGRNKLEEMMKSDSFTLRDFKLNEDFKVNVLNDDAAVLAYKVREDLIVDGKPVSLEALDASTWVRRNGKWVCALHTEAIQGDPFGRDRIAQKQPM